SCTVHLLEEGIGPERLGSRQCQLLSHSWSEFSPIGTLITPTDVSSTLPGLTYALHTDADDSPREPAATFAPSSSNVTYSPENGSGLDSCTKYSHQHQIEIAVPP